MKKIHSVLLVCIVAVVTWFCTIHYAMLHAEVYVAENSAYIQLDGQVWEYDFDEWEEE